MLPTSSRVVRLPDAASWDRPRRMTTTDNPTRLGLQPLPAVRPRAATSSHPKAAPWLRCRRHLRHGPVPWSPSRSFPVGRPQRRPGVSPSARHSRRLACRWWPSARPRTRTPPRSIPTVPARRATMRLRLQPTLAARMAHRRPGLTRHRPRSHHKEQPQCPTPRQPRARPVAVIPSWQNGPLAWLAA